MKRSILIVGAGPAGASAALWAESQGWPVEILEAEPQPGGQLHLIHFEPPNLALGYGGEGEALAKQLAAQLQRAKVAVRQGTRAIELQSDPLAVRTEAGLIPTDAVIVATGVRRRRLEVPGERELERRGVSYSATADRAGFAGQEVAVVGGGDAAYENALLLAEVGCRVTLLVRDRPRARGEFQDRVGASGAIRVREDTRVRAILGEDRVDALDVEGSGGASKLPVSGVVIKVGVIPNTEWCAALERDPEGYLRVDQRLRTSHSRIWAAGDVARPVAASLAVALGHGVLAVIEARKALAPDLRDAS